MNKIVLFSLLILSTFSYGQGKIKVEYDQSSKQIKQFKSSIYSRKNGVQIELTGINSLLHKVSITYEDNYWKSTPPEALSAAIPFVSQPIPEVPSGTILKNENAESVGVGTPSAPFDFKYTSTLEGYERMDTLGALLDTTKKYLVKSNEDKNQCFLICRHAMTIMLDLYPKSDSASLYTDIQIEIDSLKRSYKNIEYAFENLTAAHYSSPDYKSMLNNLISNKVNNANLKVNRNKIRGIYKEISKGASSPEKIKLSLLQKDINPMQNW